MRLSAGKAGAFLLSSAFVFSMPVSTPQLFEFFTSEIEALALECYAPSPIAWQQGSYSKSQIDNYLSGVSYWNDHKWKSVGDTSIGSSACGIFSLINSVYYKTGNFLDPTEVADWAADHGSRYSNSGVDTGFFRKYSDSYGSSYGFSYAGEMNSVDEALSHVRNGGTICGCVPGHWIAIVDYDSSSGKYLILDSAGSSKRCNSINGWISKGVAWVSPSVFKSGDYTLVGRCKYGLSYSGNHNPVPAPSNITDNYSYPSRTLYKKSPMMNGNDVKWLQSALSNLGFNCKIDGWLGEETSSRIREYQSSRGLDVDGKAGPITLSSLKNELEGKRIEESDGYSSNTENYGSPDRLLKYISGSLMRGEDVKWVQSAMNKLISAGLVVDGIYGKNTYNAVKNFQASHGLAVDGIVGPNTVEMITRLMGDSDYTPPQQSIASILKNGYEIALSTLKNGSKGDGVRWLQIALNSAIGAGLDVDGHYGPKTAAAVKLFQSQQGLAVDGVFGAMSRGAMQAVLAGMGITICGGSEVPSTASVEINKKYYAEEESISFEFDSDTANEFTLVILDENGNKVQDYITDEYSLTIALESGYYTAYVIASNEQGSIESNRIEFNVIKQSAKIENASSICSEAYGKAISCNSKTDEIYTSDDITNESVWKYISYDNWTFNIYNVSSGKKLCISDGKLKMTDFEDNSDETLWYLYEENGMSFIKNFTSDLAITVSSSGEVMLKELDTSSNAQSITFVSDNKSTISPEIIHKDDTHIELKWNTVQGAEKYSITVFDIDGVTEDGIFDYVETSDTFCTVEVPENVNYEIYMESLISDDIIIGTAMDSEEEETQTPTEEEETNMENDLTVSMLVQLQNYLLGSKNYSPSVIKELDMNFDDIIDVYDFVLLRDALLDS
ncbi:MAG: peptidoglycan-binding protein [Ruminococcus sp.]|nr:peptidoglycan-binding protein [Ruminococcus sp.]